MPTPKAQPWKPTTIRRFIKAINSSACTARVLTNAGPAYLKALGSSEGPHTLACEWVGTHLAKWLGLPTFDCALIEVTTDDEIPFHNGGAAQPGPAFVTRAESGEPWSGKKRQLNRLFNPQDISRLVVFDTWTLNCDRHGPPEPGKMKKQSLRQPRRRPRPPPTHHHRQVSPRRPRLAAKGPTRPPRLRRQTLPGVGIAAVDRRGAEDGEKVCKVIWPITMTATNSALSI
jgi:hypothetical protein